MPQRRQRAAIYVRESDISLAMDSTTVESAIKALLDHCQKKNYLIDPSHIFKEVISGYSVFYFDRTELMNMLKAAERHEFDVLVVTEIRALSRRGAGEVLVINSLLQKANVSLETLSEVITDDPMGEVLLSFRASWARIEREQSFIRMQRGKKDRIEIGKAPPNGHRCYGYVLVDTEKEVKGRYEFNTAIIHKDQYGTEWSEIKVRKCILDLVRDGNTLHSISMRLNALGVPPPRKPKKGVPYWDATAVRRIAESPINIGEVWVNQYKRVGKRLIKRPKEEWILLEGIAPALIDEETYREIMTNISFNKQESLRNNQHAEELGLLRAGYIFCGICQRRMSVRYNPSKGNGLGIAPPYYRCHHKEGDSLHVSRNHHTQIHLKLIDNVVKEKIREALLKPEVVRAKVAEIRKKNKPVVDETEIVATIAAIEQKMKNLYTLAENAPDDEELARLTLRMQELAKQKREAKAMLYVLEDDAEEREKIEKELQRFEAWVAKVQPSLTDPVYMEEASYTELRAAIRVLGIKVTVFPTSGEWPYRYNIDVTVPEILATIGQSSR
ncbi:MAG: recombinase family protein [Ktedonobacteraceae bacterium]